jgi:Uma2 family endonuclease
VAPARPTLPDPWTIEDFLAWEREQEERYEYVGGVIRMMVGGTLDHNRIALNIASRFRTLLAGGPCSVFMEGVKVVSASATMYPDVVVTRTPGSGQSDVVPEPEIVFEVLSRSTQTFDRGPKLDTYQQIASLKQSGRTRSGSASTSATRAAGAIGPSRTSRRASRSPSAMRP